MAPHAVRYTVHFDLKEDSLKLTAITNEFGHSVKEGSDCWGYFNGKQFCVFLDEVAGGYSVVEMDMRFFGKLNNPN